MILETIKNILIVILLLCGGFVWVQLKFFPRKMQDTSEIVSVVGLLAILLAFILNVIIKVIS